MSTPLTDSINALTQYANEVTGKQDATLSDAVGSLVEGYGGGSFGIFSKLEVQELTVTGRTSPSTNISGNTYTVNHTLGVVPDFIFIYPKQRMIPAENSNDRIIQFLFYFDIGSHKDGSSYVASMGRLVRLYTSESNSMYEQYEVNPHDIINTITASSVTVGGVNIPNSGIFNGDYWVLIGKIADTYTQGEQVVYSK